MAFKISVPRTGGHDGRVVFCNVDTESEALRLAESVIGYAVLALPYAVTECEAGALESAGIEKGGAAIQR